MAVAITGAKAGDRIKMKAKCLSNGALSSALSLADNYISDGCLL